MLSVATFFMLWQAPTTVECPVLKKISAESQYTEEEIAKWRFSGRVIFAGERQFLQRCSYETRADAVTCDTYQAERVEYDANSGIRKLYFFDGQYDFQIFPNGSFVENNGRGTIAFGQCYS